MLALMVLAACLAATGANLWSSDDWWKSAVIYQIYPRSFLDTNGDGIGDLRGITQKLIFLKETGIDAIWLSPIYLSPMYDFGYDIQDYKQIAPEYGTMEDFDQLMEKAKKIGIRVILDFVPNHTSNESEWFQKSVQRDRHYADYYVWADGKQHPMDANQHQPPSNWVSVFRKSAWEYNDVRKQYYLHQFVVGQPDLNYRCQSVHKEMKDVLRFWLEKGVSGFRVDAVNMLYEVDPEKYGGTYPDEGPSGASGLTPDDYEYLIHNYTKDQDETYDVIYDWRVVLDEYSAKHKESKIMLSEAYTNLEGMIRYYGNKNKDGSIPLNFAFLTELKNTSNARDIKTVIDKWMMLMPIGKVANWVNGNHDQSRLASRHGVERIDAMNMLTLILPGIAITYQGEEIGMTDGHVSWRDTKDPQACNTDDPVNYWMRSRDPARTPYQWDSTNNAGFTLARYTWLPVADSYRLINLAAQMVAPKSHYKFYKDLVAMKRSPAFRLGDLDVHAVSDSVLVVTRLLPAHPAVVGIINFLREGQTVDLSHLRLLPRQLKVRATGVYCSLDKGLKIDKTNVFLSPHCAMVLTSVKYCC